MRHPYEAAFKEREAQRHLKAGELRRLLSPVDREVFGVIHGPKAAAVKRRITIRGIEKATGLSALAVLLSIYRLTGLGLVSEKDRPMPNRVDGKGSREHRPRAGRASGR